MRLIGEIDGELLEELLIGEELLNIIRVSIIIRLVILIELVA